MQAILDPELEDGLLNGRTFSQPATVSYERKKRDVASILYAEDEKLVREITTRLLTRAGYRITSVENGLLAWEALKTSEFDLLITDHDMPQVTGGELVARLRRKNVTLPVIMASGSAGLFSGPEYRWLGLSACVQKPFTPDRLLQAIQRVAGAGA